jgi:hypothetical protein
VVVRFAVVREDAPVGRHHGLPPRGA